MEKLLFTILSVGLLIGLNSCIDDPAMTAEVLGASPPAFDGKAILISKTASSITVKANVAKANGYEITERGFYYSLNESPSDDNGGISIPDADGTGTGEYILTIEGLKNDTRYYIRPYAINAKGTGYWHEDLIDSTNVGIVDVETLIINDSIRASTARAGGRINLEGEGVILSMGVYLSNKENSDVVDTIYYDGVTPQMKAEKGMIFICQLIGLTPSNWYYIQAFVTNTYGTTFGAIESLNTLDGKPVLGETTNEVPGFTDVKLSSSVSNRNDETVTIVDRGFCWAKDTDEPTTSNNVKSCGSGTGIFEGTVDGLVAKELYYVRAYAKSNFGFTVYDEKALIIQTKEDIPTVRTYAATNVQNGNAEVGGIISNPGMSPVTATGICWSTTNDKPDKSDFILPLTAGSGGVFSGSLTRLRGGVTYYMRAYADNNQGTGYGEVEQFTTPAVFTGGLRPFPGDESFSMAYFSIDNYLYILGGDKGVSYTNELWRYSISNDSWAGRRAFIGSPAKWQTSVTYGKGALVYGGYNGNGDELPGIFHFQEEPENNWSYYEGPPDSAIVNRTVGYSYGSNVFFIGGMSADTVREDVWSFDFTYKIWEKKTDFPVKQYGGIAIRIDDVVYVGMGNDAANICNGRLWTTDVDVSTWNVKNSYAVTGNVLGGVACNRRLYIVDESGYLIEYNPETDAWTRKSQLPNTHKVVHCMYTVSNKIYIGLGSSSVKSFIVYDPVWDN